MSLGQKKEEEKTQLLPLTEEELEELQLAPYEIWYLMVDEIPCGPYSLSNLQNFIKDHRDFNHQTPASNRSKEGWEPLAEYIFFDRRVTAPHPSPPLPSTNDEEKKQKDISLILLIDGKPTGPYRPAEVNRQLEQKEISSTTLVSGDQGQSWCRIYEHPGINRRHVKKLSSVLNFRKLKLSPKKQIQEDKSTQKELLELITLVRDKEHSPEDKHPGQLLEEDTPSGKRGLKVLLIATMSALFMSLLVYFINLKDFSKSNNQALGRSGSKGQTPSSTSTTNTTKDLDSLNFTASRHPESNNPPPSRPQALRTPPPINRNPIEKRRALTVQEENPAPPDQHITGQENDFEDGIRNPLEDLQGDIKAIRSATTANDFREDYRREEENGQREGDIGEENDSLTTIEGEKFEREEEF